MNSKVFGETLQNIRKDKNLSVEELAEATGISAFHLRSIESGKRLPSLPVFVDLANELKVKSDELLTGNVACADVLQINEVTREMIGMSFKEKNMVKEIFDVCKRYFNDC